MWLQFLSDHRKGVGSFILSVFKRNYYNLTSLHSHKMLPKGYSFKAKSRASSGSIFQPKQSVPALSNPLEEEEKKYEAKKSKISPKRASSRIVSNVSFDPLSDPLSAGDSATLETVQDTQTRGQRKENEEHSGEWRRVRREVLTSHSSTSYTTNLPSITIRPGENSARHLTVQEFVVELEVKQEQMISRWAEDDRVEALKIIIQALKSLSDTTAIRFYPAKFFLVLDMVTAFVDLVEVRLLSLNSEAAQEVAKNWLYKISSIREMVPRFFLETAFTRFEGFYSGFKDDRTFARLSDTIRGLGNPLLAVYSRMFLSRVCSTSGELEVHTQRTHHQEISSVLNTLRSEKPKTFEKITFEDYVALLKPAVSWNTYLVTSLHSEGSLLALMKEMSYQTDQAAGLVLETFLNHLSGDFCSGNTQFLVSTCLNLPTANIMRGLGRALLRAQSGLANKQELMNSCWSSVSQLDTLDQFLPSAAVWLEFAALHFQNRELNKLLGLVIKRINKDRREEDNLPPQFNDHLKDILVNVVRRRSPSVTGVFRIQNFLSVFSLITKEEVKAAAAKEVLEELVKEEIVPTGESVVLETVVSLTSVLGSSVTALTSRDEARQVSGLIVNGVVRCSLLPDTHQHLSLLTKLRDQFSHLDLVQAALVRQVNTLAASLGELSHRQVRQALAAFSYITIPSIRDTRTKMSLYLETAQVSMINSCLGQAEACCRALNTLLLEGEIIRDYCY